MSNDPQAYLDTIARMERDIHPVDMMGAAASIAISLKRIADGLDLANDLAIGIAELSVPDGHPSPMRSLLDRLKK